jgi:hypothetical protein
MGLNSGDLGDVPPDMGAKDCYKRIYEWHKNAVHDIGDVVE